MADVVGLTIQQQTLRAVETRVGRKGRGTVLRTAEVPIDPRAFDGARLVDAAAFTAALRELWAQGQFKTKHIRVVIDGRLAVIRRTELPAMSAPQLRKAASYDIAELLNYSIEEAVFDVDEVGSFERNDAPWAQALVVAVESAALEDLRAACSDAGLRVLSLDLAAEALARGTKIAEIDGPVAILDCEDATTNIVIRDASGLLFARTLGVGVGESAISVADELESALAQLSAETGQAAADDNPVGAGVSAIVESIRRTLSYYAAELDERPLERVVVAGSRGHATGLVAALEHALGAPAEQATANAAWPNGIAIEGFETAIGASIGSKRSPIRHLELRSDHERAIQSRRRSQIAALTTGIPSVALVMMGALGAWADVTAVRQTADQAESTTDVLALRLAELDDTSNQIAQWQTTVREIETIEAQQLRFDLVVRQLAATMPPDTRLLSIELERGGTAELPPGYTGGEPAGTVSISGVADDIEAVSRWLTNAGESTALDGVWLEQSSFGPVGADGAPGALFSAHGVITYAVRQESGRLIGDELLSEGTEGEDQ